MTKTASEYKDLIEKVALSRDEDTETRYFRDIYVPAKADRFTRSIRHNVYGSVMGGGAFPGLAAGLSQRSQRANRLNSLYEKYDLGTPSETALKAAAVRSRKAKSALLEEFGVQRDWKHPVNTSVRTPEAITQMARRQQLQQQEQ